MTGFECLNLLDIFLLHKSAQRIVLVMAAIQPTTQVVPSGSNDHRPNSGMREGDISHAEVNAEIRGLSKTIIFGQQTRLRNGFLMEDDKLSRFYAGHPLVLFFYRGLHRLPDYLIDALFKNGISVTLVGGKDLLVYQNVTTYARSNERRLAYESGEDLLIFKDVRTHQTLHVGFTRKTVYIPEGFLRESINQGYASWAISSILINQCWPLLDYLLILEFIRCAQRRFRTHFTLGSPTVIKRVLYGLNSHFVESEESEDSEFDAFYRHYCNYFLGMDRSIVGQDPYLLADRIFDEAQERVWAEGKLFQIASAFNYPPSFHVNRDVVHQMAVQSARNHRLSIEPETAEDALHDLRDAAEFNIDRQSKSNALMDHLIGKGLSGIAGFVDVIANESASNNRLITLDRRDGYDIVDVFKSKLEALSSTPQEGVPGSICNDFCDLLKYKILCKLRTLVDKFTALPKREQRESTPYLKHLLRRIVRFAHSEDLVLCDQLEIEVNTAKRIGPLIKMAKYHLGVENVAEETELLVDLLKKLDTHPAYHTTILSQVRDLTGEQDLLFGTSSRYQIDMLFRMIPDRSYLLSSDPQGLRTCLHRFENLQKVDPDSQELLTQLAGVFVRLDRDENYTGYIEKVFSIGLLAKPALESILNKTSRNNQARKVIRQTAAGLLKRF